MRKWTKNNPKPDGTKYDIFRDGLRIFTTLDSRLQEIGEKGGQCTYGEFARRILSTEYPRSKPYSSFFRSSGRGNRHRFYKTKHVDRSAGGKCALLEKMKKQFGLRFKSPLKWKFLAGKAIATPL